MKTQVILISLFVFFISPTISIAQMVSISGYVKNLTTGEAPKNATIYESISGIGTITNNEGYYRLLLNQGERKLEFSSPGFGSVTSALKLKADTTITVELVPLASATIKAEGENVQQKDEMPSTLQKPARKAEN
jgi:hypothetical protein